MTLYNFVTSRFPKLKLLLNDGAKSWFVALVSLDSKPQARQIVQKIFKCFKSVGNRTDFVWRIQVCFRLILTRDIQIVMNM